MRQITGAAIAMAAACVIGAVALANFPVAGHSAPPVTRKTASSPRVPGPTVMPASSFVSVYPPEGTADVRGTGAGAKFGTVHPPRGSKFFAVGGGADDRRFVLAAQGSSGTHLYLLRLDQHGQPGRPLVKLALPALPRHFGSCQAELSGLAVGPADGGLVAASMLSYCPTGRAGQSEILVARISSGHILATFHPGRGYPMWLSWTQAGALVYDWSGDTTGVFLIPDATNSHSKARLLIGNSASVGGFSGANYPLISLNGSSVFTTVVRGSGTFAIAVFSANGKTRKVLTPPVRNPTQFCGPLWADAAGRRVLAACGDGAEFRILNGHVTKLHRPWKLPTYPTPGAPLIAW
jgi:hypothetical protein